MRLITHNGHFHYDELLASVILLFIFPDAKILRTRDLRNISPEDIVYDVGGVYDPAKNRFDHHQRSFNDTYSPEYNVKLSSAGLIYRHFHEKLFETFGLKKDDSPMIYDVIVKKVYDEFILPTDALDNGYDIAYGSCRIRSMPDVIRSFYFNESPIISTGNEDSAFVDAMKFVKFDFTNYLKPIINSFKTNYKKFYNILKDFSDDIFITEDNVEMDLLFELVGILKKNLKFIIVKSSKYYQIYTIPVVWRRFAIKYPLHSEWRGLSDEALVKASNIENCVFVHANGFMGANTTLEGALEMCKESLKYLENEK